MADKSIVLITGANTGLGYEIVKSLLSSTLSYTILLGGRSLDKANAAASQLQKEFSNSTSSIETVQIDISSDESIAKCFETVSAKYDRVDVLINNAGVSLDMQAQKGEVSAREAWRDMWMVNVFGSYEMTNTFAPLLIKSSNPRLIFITSGTSSIDEAARGLPYTAAKPAAGWPKPKTFDFTGYRSSKAGLNMLMADYTRVFKEDGVKIWAISPGFLATGLAGAGVENLKKMGALDPSVGGNFVKDVVEGKRDHDQGKVIRKADVQPF